jgi:hypothetical protein
MWHNTRTILWRTMGDVLELCEVSLNYSLVGGRVRFRFQAGLQIRYFLENPEF